MGIHLPAANAYIHERAKFETLPVPYGDGVIMPLSTEQGGRGPYVYQPYPRMLYKAGRPTGTRVELVASLVVHSEGEERVQRGQGWAIGPDEAVQAVHDQDHELAVLAANRNYNDRGMSEKAKAESNAAEVESSQHLGEIPRTPIKKRGRPVKKAAVAAEG